MRKRKTLSRSLISKPGRRIKTAQAAGSSQVAGNAQAAGTGQTVGPVRSPVRKRTPDPKAAPMPEARTTKRRRFGFLIFLLVLILLALGGIYAGAVYFWDYLESFEVSRPEHIIDHMSENIDHDFWRSSVENALAQRLTHFEKDASQALKPHLNNIMDVRYSIRHRPEESTDELLVYTVRAGASDIGTVRFKPMEEAGHGFFIWGIDSMELLDSFLEPFSRSITITASQNAQVEVNGVEVPGEYRIECEFEHGKTYQIHNLYGDVEVTVIEFDGQKPDALFAQYGEYYFPITIPFDVNYNIIVPYGALVYADEVRVSAENITESIIKSQIFRGITDQSKVPEIAANRYEFGFEYLYVEPVITVTNAQGIMLGSFISEDGETIYQEEYSESLKEAHEETAVDFMRAYVRFSSNAGGNPGSNLASLGNYMLRTSTLFRHLQNAVTTRTWTQVSQLTFHEIEATNFRQYGDDYFTCEVNYSLTQRGAASTVDLEMSYEILFVRSNGRWLAVNVIALD